MSEMDNLQEAEGLQENNTLETTTEEATAAESEVVENDVISEIENENAEDAEDHENTIRHEIVEKDYHAMSMDELADELADLIKNHPVQTIGKHVNQIKEEFNSKYSALIDEKKEEFLAQGGNEIDFSYSSNAKKRFNASYGEFRNQKAAYHKDLESKLKSNYERRIAIIDEIKGLLGTEENINSTFKHFKNLQEEWKNAGPIPRDRYNTLWNTYHHHVERFYDFLDLNRDLRDLDFKHNLEKKLKIVDQAEALINDSDPIKAFRELQTLHKIWKEEIGPVARESREEIWSRFSNATKQIHEKRQSYFSKLDEVYEQNLVVKNEIIEAISAIATQQFKSHNEWQEKIKEIEALRERFFKAGKVPLKVNEKTWASFKEAVRGFNRHKNAFYKNLKKDQLDNLARKRELIEIAEANKDNEDFEVTTPLMKKIQSDWKKIGHVPKKESDKIWKQFKGACNHYFDRLHSKRNASNEAENAALEQKEAYLAQVADVTLEGEHQDKLNTIKGHIEHWKSLGRVPRNKRKINDKFNKIIDSLFNQLDIDKAEADLIKYTNKVDAIADDQDALESELIFVRRKIDEVKSEINQLENNLAFFANASEDSPIVKDVHRKIDAQRDSLKTWKQRYQHIKGMFA